MLTFPEHYRQRTRFTNDPERLNQKIERRIRMVRTSPTREACLRLVMALAGAHSAEEWVTGTR